MLFIKENIKYNPYKELHMQIVRTPKPEFKNDVDFGVGTLCGMIFLKIFKYFR